MQPGVLLRNMGPASTPDTVLAAARAADAQPAIADLWVTDHIAIPPDDAEGSNGRYLDPLATLAVVAGATCRIGLGTAVLVLPYRPALPTAKWVATIQELSAGQLRWRPPGARLGRKLGLAAFDFSAGTLVLTEASTRKRAGLWCVRGADALAAFDAGGVEPLEVDLATFRAALLRERHTLKRALTDPRLVAGVGNAYSDEILHRARLSPVRLTDQLDDDELARLHAATGAVLRDFTERLRAEVGPGFPQTVTAFRDDMAVHGKYRQPCPACGTPVQRIVHAEHETNYCPGCQTGGRLLADRALSRLLKQDWPRTLAELEERRGR